MTNAEILAILDLPEDVVSTLQSDSANAEEYSANMNEFLTQVVNKIVYQRVYSMEGFTNPFAKFKSYPIEYGDTLENLFVELPQGYEFNPNATDPFTKVNPSVKAFYNSINLKMQYCVTIQRDIMRMAFLKPNGLQSLIDVILRQLQIAMEVDEYKAQLTVLNNEDAYVGETVGGTTTWYKTFNADAYDTAEEASKALLIYMADLVDEMTLAPTTSHNKAGIKTVSRKEDLYLIIKPEVLQRINFEFLAGVFNLSKVEMVEHIIKVPTFQTASREDSDTAEVVGENLDFIILDKNMFENHQVLRDGGAIYNPKGRYINHYTDNWNLFGLKTFVNAHAFKITDTNKYLHKA